MTKTIPDFNLIGGRKETLVLLIGDGLSGTYQNMEGGESTLEDSGHIHVLNTKTLVAPGKSGPDPQRAGEQDQLDVNKQNDPGIHGPL